MQVDLKLPVCKPLLSPTVPQTLEAAIQQLYCFIDSRTTDEKSLLELQSLKDEVNRYLSIGKKAAGVQCSLEDKRTRFSMQGKVVDDSDEECTDPQSESFESDEEGPARMLKQNRFQMMVTRSQRRSHGRRIRPSLAFDPFVVDFEMKKMETRSTKKRRLL